MVEQDGLSEQAVDHQLVLVLHQRINVLQLGVGHLVQRVLLEVVLLEVRIHVETGRSEVVRPRHIGDDALPPLSNCV